MNYYIHDIAYYLPEKIIDNNYLANECGIDKNFLEKKIGIEQRHIAAADETTSEMACKSVQGLLQAANLDKEQIDVLVVCTQNPDYRLPTTACLVQDKLQLKKSTIAFDVNLGCSGFVYGLPIVGNFIKTGMAQRAVLVTVDQYSKIVDYRDKSTAALFGDAATAILLGPCQDGFGVIDGVYGTDGSGAEHLILYNSGIAKNPEKSGKLYMNGREIFKFAVTVVPDSVRKVLANNNLAINDIKYFILHQANKFMLQEMQKRLDIPEDRMVIDMALYGNTVSSTIPISLKHLMEAKKLQTGDLVLFCGFGVGLSWGTVLYKFLQTGE